MFSSYTTEAVEENENLWLCNVTEYDTKLQCRCSHKGHAWSPVLISGFEYCYIVLKCTGKTLLLAVNKLDSNLQKKKKISMSIAHYFQWDEGNRTEFCFQKRVFFGRDAVYSHPGCFRSHHS